MEAMGREVSEEELAIIEPCPDCGAAMSQNDGECSMCSATAMSERVVAAERELALDEDLAKPKQIDGFRSLELCRKALSRRLRRIMVRERELTAALKSPSMTEKERTQLRRLETCLTNELCSVVDKLNKNSKEMLGYYAARSKIVDQMTPEQMQAQVYIWFRQQADPIQIMMLETLKDQYNQQKVLRQTRRAKRAWARSKHKLVT